MKAHPVVSCNEARELEARLFAGEEAKEWPAMQQAGRAIAAAVLRDFEEIGGFPAAGKILVLVGKGHNGGDALIAAQAILERFPSARIDVVFVFGERALRPLAARAWKSGCGFQPQSWKVLRPEAAATCYDLLLDGVFGFQFRPPISAEVMALFAVVDGMEIRLRAAVDLPSGLSEETKPGDPVLAADFTYATGSVKSPLVNGLNAERVGRLRYRTFARAHAGRARAADAVATIGKRQTRLRACVRAWRVAELSGRGVDDSAGRLA
jgi:ADP-dependent NAD(P)H-hydrate dehydratase / NAD(P)H-hydrate epimerase